MDSAELRVAAWLEARGSQRDSTQTVSSIFTLDGGLVTLQARDIKALLDRIKDVTDENAMLNDANLGLAARVKKQAETLEAVHQDLLDRAEPDGTVAVGASVWIALDAALEGGA